MKTSLQEKQETLLLGQKIIAVEWNRGTSYFDMITLENSVVIVGSDSEDEGVVMGILNREDIFTGAVQS